MRPRSALLLAVLLLPLPARAAELSVAVFPLAAKTNINQTTADLVTDLVVEELQDTRMFGRLVAPREIEVLMGATSREKLLDCVGDRCAVIDQELAGALGVTHLVTGNVGRISNSFLLNLAITDTRTLATVSSVVERVNGTRDDVLLEAIRPATRKLMQRARFNAPTPPPPVVTQPQAAASQPPVAPVLPPPTTPLAPPPSSTRTTTRDVVAQPVQTAESGELLPTPKPSSPEPPRATSVETRARPAVLGMRAGALVGALGCGVAVLLGIGAAVALGVYVGVLNGAAGFVQTLPPQDRDTRWATAWGVTGLFVVAGALSLLLAVGAAVTGVALFAISWGI